MKNSSTIGRMRRLLLGTGVGFYPLLSCALGLGDLQVESQLNQPLRARIEIVGVADLQNGPPVRARFAPDVVPSGAANGGLLQSLKLSIEEDSSHRHFVVVSSAEPLTEPLFDLPVQVSAESVQVVRNYPVLLDPPTLEDKGRGAPMSAGAVERMQALPRETGVAERHASAAVLTRRGGKRHLRVGAKLSAASSASVGSARAEASAGAPGKSATQDQLEGQLVTLQQMLARMQETISAQDARIAELTRRIAAGREVQPPAAALTRVPATRVDPPPRVAAAETVSEESPPFWLRPVAYYGIAAVGVIGAILGLALARLRKARARPAEAGRMPLAGGRGFADSRNAAELASESAGSGPDRWPSAAAPTSVAAPAVVRAPAAASTGGAMTYGSSRRMSGTHGYEVVDRLATTQETAIVNELAMAIGSASSTTATIATTAAIPTEELQALELAAALDPESTARIEANTDATVEENGLPFSAASTPAQSLEMQPDRSGTNREIIKLLESSLDAEPHRTDIQLKLLEMYHQEALGNRASFHSLLSKVAAENRGLSCAQQVHLDMLQRTLDDPKAGSGSDISAEAAI